MVNPAMFGISREQQERARQIGQLVTVTIEKRAPQGEFTVRFRARQPAQPVDLRPLVDQFVESMATQLNTLFAIEGEIIEA